VPTATRTRRIAADQTRIWELLADPRERSRWVPGCNRVEGVTDDEWTEVFLTKHGKQVRLDFRFVRFDRPWRILWEQELEGTPFARVLEESLTEVVLEPDGIETIVTIAQSQKLRGYSRTGGLLLRRGSTARLDRALAGLAALLAAGGS